jgi:copper transport protein
VKGAPDDAAAAGEVAAQAEPADRFSAVLVAAVVLVTFALTGHAGQGRPAWLSISADALHLAAACAWLGGLVVLAWAFLPAAGGRHRGDVLPRWSRLAMGSVAVLVVTGTYQAWREVGSVAALLGTEYGRLVLGKVAGIVVLLALGELGRRWVRRHVSGPRPAPAGSGRLRRVAAPSEAGAPAAGRAGAVATAVSAPSDPPGPAAPEGSAPVLRLRESVLAEVGIGVAVLALTAALVSTVPARQDYAPPFSGAAVARSAEGETVRVAVEVSSPRVGTQTIRVRTTSDDGRPLPVSSVQGALLERDTGLGPVRAAFTGDPAAGVLAAEQVVVPTPGAWTLTLQVSTDPLTTYTASLTYDVR